MPEQDDKAGAKPEDYDRGPRETRWSNRREADAARQERWQCPGSRSGLIREPPHGAPGILLKEPSHDPPRVLADHR